MNSKDKKLSIGNVFTPIEWGQFAIAEFDLYSKWMNGATIFDPTMGEGNLLEALVEFGLYEGKRIEELPVSNLFGNELNTKYYKQALKKFREKYRVNMSKNFTNEDFLLLENKAFDFVFGNPPWQNFVDLPDEYKEKIKPYFFTYDLIKNSQDLLLGGSRIDFAALIIQRAIKDFLKPGGEAVFFMPLSLLLNDGANQNFRTYSINHVNYSIEKVYDFETLDIFGKISTRYGLAHFKRDQKPSFPIAYLRMENENWVQHVAKPLFASTDPLSIIGNNEEDLLDDFEPIAIPKESLPRQGINTCGANELFFFDTCCELDEETVLLSNKRVDSVPLPKEFIYPLLTAGEFETSPNQPSKWVLIPYNKNGKPLELSQLEEFPSLKKYLFRHKTALKNRKGTMLSAILNRGHWWAMLGVGEYNFFPYKIVWEAYGKTTFSPKLFEGNWQANQSLQAFIPVRLKKEALRILKRLQDKRIEKYLRSLKMEGTMNWAQPGKIKKFVEIN